MGGKLVIIGGTAAGLSAASKAKRLMPELEVTVFERSGYVSYGACGLPYFIGDMIKMPEDLIELSPEQLKCKRGIEVHIRHEVAKINRGEQSVEVTNLLDGRNFTASYDYLVIATGARSVNLPIPGSELAGVFTLRNIEDGIRIKAAVESGVRRAVVIGGGFIGLEMAEQLSLRGVNVQIVEALPRLLPFLSEEHSEIVLKELRSNGVNVRTGGAVQSINGKNGVVCSISVDDGTEIEADMVLISVGVIPESALAKECGLKLGIKGSIVVDDFQRTEDRNIWACGDCSQTRHMLTGKSVYAPMGAAANKQGRIAGGNIAGEEKTFRGVMGSAATKVFELYIATTGLSEVEAAREGIDAISAAIVKSDKASYYPGGADNMLRLIFERITGRLLGTQGLGSESVSGRINVLAAAISSGMTVQELGELDLVYSPSVAPVYDPILIAASQGLKRIKA